MKTISRDLSQGDSLKDRLGSFGGGVFRLRFPLEKLQRPIYNKFKTVRERQLLAMPIPELSRLDVCSFRLQKRILRQDKA